LEEGWYCIYIGFYELFCRLRACKAKVKQIHSELKKCTQMKKKQTSPLAKEKAPSLKLIEKNVSHDNVVHENAHNIDQNIKQLHKNLATVHQQLRALEEQQTNRGRKK